MKQIFYMLTFIFLTTISCQNKVLKVPIENISSLKKSVFNIKDYGAVGDSLTMDTKAIQKTIDACHENGGGKVWVPAGNYIIGTIKLKSNVALSLDYGASLLGSQDIIDYVDLPNTREGNAECLIFAENASNISIEGLGIIDGRGTPEAFPRKEGSPRPRLLRMVNCDGLTFSGVTYKRPAFWGLHIIDSKNIHFNGVTIRFRNNGYNNDGLDIDGCEDVLIENCDIDAGDDAICLKSSLNPCKNIVVRNCKVSSNTAALKFGTSSRGGFINVKVYNCYFYDSPMGAIKLQLVDGGRLENIDISRIVMEDVGNPIFIRLGNRGRNYDKILGEIQKADVKPEGVPVGVLKNIRISDVVAHVKYQNLEREAYKGHTELSPEEEREVRISRTGPIMIAGIPGHYIENVVLENIEISYPGGGTVEDTKRVISEDIARYPEQFFFGILPAWGAYVRHSKNITFKNVNMITRNSDEREMIVLDDVDGFIND
ncbi:glycoside hydrolase family 28 protein [Formosa sp. PL04]|uniref:glycoside hydrolase family 28 protein n=1 Tax=Formosa sp. PL04 TaxID=3081755 RepID=UPI002982322A|nr:glycosyl hydrolase family 28 protein [Formosa sp. PL04]MDW5290140.1 glycosyl hydrolase family 28 protein [Formosa sp. PL04]